eukprot:TRINITY_DN36412_c0_g2_i1.p1 TRINITY_DN36412_c0_g2~~TRINITY_DN36412_c0_g2_i1.p1  ORF type:complete len:1215 (+),score=190.73 TRINITY_DN36412_c0_g2_i1:85-3729(+)
MGAQVRILTIWALLLAALDREGSSLADAQASYPMAAPTPDAKCTCAGSVEGMGWSQELMDCVQSGVTTCDQCNLQRECALIHTVAGDGVQAFLGDCRSSSQGCLSADSSSLAFPVSLAIDEKDNLYIADAGNNRIRMLKKSHNTIVTIAGSGAHGFGGDGGDARLAKLRMPQGIALKPRVPLDADGNGREVYFSDFSNQRIRKLVRQWSGWVIYTVAGTGTQGDNPLCDTACSALTEALLWNPRALAFSSTQDLYFIDSGSGKVRMLTTSLGDPAASAPATMSTFTGHATWPSSSDMYSSFKGNVKKMLPGHWVVPNEFLQLRGMYFLTIDSHDNLWLVDSDNNRIFEAPLRNRSRVLVSGDFGKHLNKFMDAAFLLPDGSKPTKQDLANLALSLADNYKTWLPIVHAEVLADVNVAMDAQVFVEEVSKKAGFSYWRYGEPGASDSWCNELEISNVGPVCERTPAQFGRFSGIMGMCFDQADNAYVLDTEGSQIVYFEDNKNSVGTIEDNVHPGMPVLTQNGCPCLKEWVQVVGSLPGSSGPGDKYCAQNLDALAEIRATFPGERAESMINFLPNCTTTNYCARVWGDSYTPWCVVDTALVQQSDPCAEEKWGYCDLQASVERAISWRVSEGTGLLGNELRFQTSYKLGMLELQTLSEYFLTEDLWISNGTVSEVLGARQPGSSVFLGSTSVMTGFVEGPSRPSNCTQPCCGLPTSTISATVLGFAQASPIQLCNFRNKSDLRIIQDYLTAMRGPPGAGPEGAEPSGENFMAERRPLLNTVWEELESLVTTFSGGFRSQEPKTVPVSEYETVVDKCKQRCAGDHLCSSFMVRMSEKNKLFSSGTPCIFFSTNSPSDVYTIDRTKYAFRADEDPVTRKRALKAFEGPLNAVPRVSGDMNGLYVSRYESLILSKDTLGEAMISKAHLLQECQAACLDNPNCHAIAFPGCYLLRKSASEIPVHSDPEFLTEVYVKEFMLPEVKAVAGYGKVNAFQAEGVTTRQAYLNRPGSCVVDSSGDLLFSDLWNHRIRRISGFNPECRYSGIFTSQSIDEYEAALAAADAACTPWQHYAQVQQEAVEHGNLTSLKLHMCNFGSSPIASAMEANGTGTSNAMVLCALCAAKGDNAACPSSLCACRSALNKVSTNYVYMNCPPQNAYADPWHKWVTAFTSCWLQDAGAAEWLTNTVKRDAMTALLDTYDVPNTTTSTTQSATTTTS